MQSFPRKKVSHVTNILEMTPSGEIVSKTTPDGEICPSPNPPKPAW